MKKILASITLLCYITVSCGVVINFHYCMDRLASTRFFVAEKKVCSNCGMHTKKSHGCCRDEVKVVQLQQDQSVAHVAFSMKPPVNTFFVPSTFFVTSFYNAAETPQQFSHPPPLFTGKDICVLNAVFRI